MNVPFQRGMIVLLEHHTEARLFGTTREHREKHTEKTLQGRSQNTPGLLEAKTRYSYAGDMQKCIKSL